MTYREANLFSSHDSFDQTQLANMEDLDLDILLTENALPTGILEFHPKLFHDQTEVRKMLD